VPLALFALALATRLMFLVGVSGFDYVGWYHDSYHHWQVAYYTLHVGLRQDPPRIWDLNGMEYFWGLFPTLIESFLLWVFNTTSFVPFRVFNILMGGVSVYLVYAISKKYFTHRIALIASGLAAILPVFWEVDTSGMLDPVGIMFLLLGLYMYESRPFSSGVCFALASLSHIEFWFLSFAMIASHWIYGRSGTRLVPSLVGWLTPMVPYFWFMQTRTGDWLYAFRWNYLSSIAGTWIKDVTVPFEAQIVPRGVAVTFLVLSGALALRFLKRRPHSYPLHVLFLAYIGMKGMIFGLSAYVVPYIAMHQLGRFLLDRLLAINYYYVSILLAIAIERFPRQASSHLEGIRRLHLGRKQALLSVAALVYLASFSYVRYEYFNPTYYVPYVSQVELAEYILGQYRGGTILSSLVIVNYWVVNHGVNYQSVVGSIYMPTSNLAESYAWLIKHNVTWLIADQNVKHSLPILADGLTHPPFYVMRGPIVYYVDQAELRRAAGA